MISLKHLSQCLTLRLYQNSISQTVWQPASKMATKDSCHLVLTTLCSLIPHCTGLLCVTSSIWQKTQLRWYIAAEIRSQKDSYFCPGLAVLHARSSQSLLPSLSGKQAAML